MSRTVESKGLKILFTYIDIWLAEMNHQTDSENSDWNSKIQTDSLEFSGIANDETNQDSPQARPIKKLVMANTNTNSTSDILLSLTPHYRFGPRSWIW